MVVTVNVSSIVVVVGVVMYTVFWSVVVTLCLYGDCSVWRNGFVY